MHNDIGKCVAKIGFDPPLWNKTNNHFRKPIMAKITDQEIIDALDSGKCIDRASTMSEEPYPIYKNESGYLFVKRNVPTKVPAPAIFSLEDLKATDWEILPSQPLNQ